ncbi:hypothetical protein DV738_g3773, partial [Chaetothyriales sp. CBS 135597]
MSFLLAPSRRIAAASPLTRAFSSTRPSQLARLTLVGRLGTDPELNDSSKGTKVIKYVIGTSYGPKDNRQTSWFRVASFAPEGPQRDYILGLQKGTLVYFEGDATMRTYEDKDGQPQTALSLVQTKIEVLKRPVPKSGEEGEQ